MSNALKLAAGTAAAAPLFSDSVFSSFCYTGNGSTQTITNGIDLAGEGGMVWAKGRSTALGHCLADSARGSQYVLQSDTTGAQIDQASIYSGFTSTGFSLGSNTTINNSGSTYVSWTFRNAPNFYGHQVVVKSSGSNQTALFPELTTLGMVRVKRTDAAGSWYVWHRSLTAGKLLIGETTAAEATLGHITVSGTTVTLVNGVIADGTYMVEAWAHDTSAEGIVQCGTFTSNGDYPSVDVGWEVQYLLTKRIDSATEGNWQVSDVNRPDFTVNAAAGNVTTKVLQPHSSAAEGASYTYAGPHARGFSGYFGAGAKTHAYLAIRRPNKPPTVGTEVFGAYKRPSSTLLTTLTTNFPPDFVYAKNTDDGAINWLSWNRLTSTEYLNFNTTAAGATSASRVIGFNSSNTSVTVTEDTDFNSISQGEGSVFHWFRRAPGFFDVVCYTGTGVAITVNHSLGVVPELMIVKSCTQVVGWHVWSAYPTPQQNQYSMPLHDGGTWGTQGDLVWGTPATGTPNMTAAVFSVGDYVGTNGASQNFVAYLFATKAGISKVGSYTGNGTSQTINCGFSAGARFVMIKRTDAFGEWYVWDTVRGIIAGNDPYLLLNSTAAEVTTTDYIDPYSAGFEISSTAPAAINASGGTFIYLAIA